MTCKDTDIIKAWVATREYDPKGDSLVNYFAVVMTGSKICHTELVFLKKCGGTQCPWAYSKTHPCTEDSHRVAYSITSILGACGVYQDVDRQYSREGVWSFLELLNAKPKQLKRLEKYCRFQHKQCLGYNGLGFCFNFLFGTEFGTKREQCREKVAAKWFCSELVCAALLFARFTIPTQPCATSPCFLHHYLLANKMAKYDAYASVIT